MNRTTRRIAVSGLTLAVLAMPVRGQVPAATPTGPAATLFSMGQPPRWQPYAAGLAAFAKEGLGGTIVLGVHRPLLNPVVGALGASAEAYGALGGGFAGGGGRVFAASPALGLRAGVDWNISAGREDFVLSFQTAVRRGGLLGRGTMVRVDWLPTRGRTLGVGISAPVRQPLAGRTRPRRVVAPLPHVTQVHDTAVLPLAPDVLSALDAIQAAATLIGAYTNLFLPENENAVQAALRMTGRTEPRAPDGRTVPAGTGTYGHAARTYAAALVQTFAFASRSAALGDLIAVRARAGLLDDMIIPYDSHFGEVRDAEESVRRLADVAQSRFAHWIRDSSRVTGASQDAVVAAHRRWLDIIERVHGELRAQWKDPRVVWLPLSLALTPDQYDEQSEVDALIARAVGRPFTDRNALAFLRSSELPLEIARTVYAARDYHVLWVHDFTGVRETGSLDDIGYTMVADVYLPALTEAVARYDSTGRLPAYMILLDQYWYEVRNGRLWMTMLEDPMTASTRLPGRNAEREAHLRGRQAALRAAVARSTRLQHDAAAAGGDGWLRRTVKVQVSITQPSDFSFRSHRIIPPLAFAPDNIMRDHRKIVFYDLNETDPYRGGMLVMGVGVGEQYASPAWEDRGYRLRGPAALEIRDEARRLLRANGFAEKDLPVPLRPTTADSSAEYPAGSGDAAGRALQVHNQVGFGRKQASVARAMLYDLAPAGSVFVVPDPLWLSESWAAMLASAAARGSRVFIIAPARANAPSPQAPVMAQQHAVLLRLLQIRERLAANLRDAGGEIQVGLFAAKAQANDIEGRKGEIRVGLARSPWIRALIPFDDKTIAVLEQATVAADTNGEAIDRPSDDDQEPPKLHQKTQLIARPGAIAALVGQPGWDEVLSRAMRAQSRQIARVAEQLRRTTPEIAREVSLSDAMLRGFELAIPEADRRRVSFYFTLGSQNEDLRGMALDGETSVLVSGFQGTVGLVDLYFLMARSTWITRESELDQYVSPPHGVMRWFARLVRFAL